MGTGELEPPLPDTKPHRFHLSGSTALTSGSTAPVLLPGRRPSSTAQAVVPVAGAVVPLGAVVPVLSSGSTTYRKQNCPDQQDGLYQI